MARPRRTLSKNQALAEICPEGGIHLGDNNLTFGTQKNFVQVKLKDPYSAGHYQIVSLQHIKQSHLVTEWWIDMMDEVHRAPSVDRNNSDLDVGGYYWDHTHEWYNYAPVGVVPRIEEILKFADV